MSVPRRRAAGVSALLIGLLLAGLLGASAPRAHAGSIGAKRAQAQAVLVQLQQLDAAAQRANSRYQVANRKLRQVEHQLRVNHQALGVARGNLGHAQRTLAKRLLQIYTTQDEQSSLAIILGARSLNELLSRIETANSMSKQDAALINQVVSFKHEIVHRRTLLHVQRVRQHSWSQRALRSATRSKGGLPPSGTCTARSARRSRR